MKLHEELEIDFSFKDLRPSLTINFLKGFNDVYCIETEVYPTELKLQYEEVCAAKWASFEEILEMIDNGSFIPYHRSIIELLFFIRNHSGKH